MDRPRVLYLHSNAEDYLADSLLHGLRVELGDRLVDVPRRDALYADFPLERRRRIYGRGFTLYGRLPEVEVERDWWLERALAGEYDVIVFADIWRWWGPWAQLRPRARSLRDRGVTLVALDGGDGQALYPHGPTWWRLSRPLPPPRVIGKAQVFKRELGPTTARLRGYGVLPAPISRRLLRGVRPIAFSIPEEHVASGSESKTKLLARHVVDPDVASRLQGASSSYAFDAESDYFADLRASRYGVTMKKAGWETLRHYELAASGCVPCFRDLTSKPHTCAPFGLHDGNCVSYPDADTLFAQLDAIDDRAYEELRAGTLEWARANTTRARARWLLDAVAPVA